MSPKTKEYILNLNIEKDSKMLRERLNICSEALDYFYASSSILKAGTKAGLSLYEIAVMCCRNDNLGEVPSKLEVLFGMAGDLAESAIQNDRWGLAAASQALQEQLSPHGGSLLTPNLKNSFARKAASAFDLTGLARSKEAIAASAVPGMTQSAGSDDSSSYSDDAENEDCVEWAAEVVNAVSLDTSTKLLAKPRSQSIESDTSSEDGGFWQKSPNSQDDSWNGSVDEESNADEESILWSPATSPSKDILGVSFMKNNHMRHNPFDMSYNSDDRARRTSHVQDDLNTEGLQIKLPLRTPSRVSFADIDNIEFDSEVEEKIGQYPQDNDYMIEDKHPDMPGMKPLGKIGRSRSYCALSSTVSENQAKDQKKITKRTSFTEDQYREYYLKFVDLVVVREITAAAATQTA